MSATDLFYRCRVLNWRRLRQHWLCASTAGRERNDLFSFSWPYRGASHFSRSSSSQQWPLSTQLLRDSISLSLLLDVCFSSEGHFHYVGWCSLIKECGVVVFFLSHQTSIQLHSLILCGCFFVFLLIIYFCWDNGTVYSLWCLSLFHIHSFFLFAVPYLSPTWMLKYISTAVA